MASASATPSTSPPFLFPLTPTTTPKTSPPLSSPNSPNSIPPSTYNYSLPASSSSSPNAAPPSSPISPTSSSIPTTPSTASAPPTLQTAPSPSTSAILPAARVNTGTSFHDHSRSSIRRLSHCRGAASCALFEAIAAQDQTSGPGRSTEPAKER